MRHGPWPGTWKATCDVCGFWFPSNELRDRWDGLKVCSKDWEIKHPQLNIKVYAETIAPPWIRSDPEDAFTGVCTLVTKQAIPGIGQPGCLIPSFINNLPH